MRSSHNNRRGFTLLEVLVATLLMAIAVTGLLGALTTSLNNAARLTDYDRAAVLARRKMDELLVTRLIPRGSPLEGQFDPAQTAGRPYKWRAVLLPFEALPGTQPGSPMLERLHLVVAWRDGQRVKSLRLDGYRSAVARREDQMLLSPDSQQSLLTVVPQ